ncbi:peptide ABC transporter substrate-binding protein [Chloroflexota bacterium]
MMNIKHGKRSVFILAFLIVLVSVLGCSGSTKTSEPPVGGTLNLYNIDPLTLDPALSRDATSHDYVLQIFSGLVRLGENLEPVPDIAKGWQVGAEGRVYTFELRKDVFFHDGSQVTAQEFKYSLERACDPATGSLTAATYLGDIAGANEKLSGMAAEVSGVRVLGDFRLEITLAAPRAYFLYKLTYPTAYVVDKDNVGRGPDWWHAPNGTGPFKLKSWRERELLVLARSDSYYGEKASLDEVVYKLWAGIPMNLYEMGEIDVAGVSLPYIDKVTDPRGPFHSQFQVAPELSFSYIGFDVTRPPFDDAAVRRAFNIAIDREKLISLVFRNMVSPANGILPVGMPGYNEALAGIEFDPAAAKRLVGQSKYGDVGNLPPVTITTSGYGAEVSGVLSAIVNEWRENLGVEVRVRQIEPQRFLYHLDEELDEMFFSGWIADYPHPDNFLGVLFRTGEENNFGGYSSAQADALLDEAKVELDEERSFTLYRQAEEMIVADAACIPLWFGQNYLLVKDVVSGYEVTPMGLVRLNEVRVGR